MTSLSGVVASWSYQLGSTSGGAIYYALWGTGGLAWLLCSLYLASRDGLPLGRTAVVLVALIPAVIIGARVHAALFETGLPLSALVRDPARLLEPGWRLPGGLLLALLVGPAGAALLRVPLGRLADCAIPPVGLLFAIGRLGCFSWGCCHGRLSNLPWAVSFPPGTEAYWNHLARSLISPGARASLPVHPLQLYLASGGLVVTGVLLRRRGRRRFVGEVGLLGIVLLSALMAGLEPLRETEMVQPVRGRLAMPIITGLLAAAAWARLIRPPRARGAEWRRRGSRHGSEG